MSLGPQNIVLFLTVKMEFIRAYIFWKIFMMGVLTLYKFYILPALPFHYVNFINLIILSGEILGDI